MTLNEDEGTRTLIRELVKKAGCICKKSLREEKYLDKVRDIEILLKKISAGIYKIDNQPYKLKNLNGLLATLKDVLVEERSGTESFKCLMFKKDGTGVRKLIRQLINRMEAYKDEYINQIKNEIETLKNKTSTPFTSQQLKRLESEIEDTSEISAYSYKSSGNSR